MTDTHISHRSVSDASDLSDFDELGGECCHSTLSDELAPLSEGNAKLVIWYCEVAKGRLDAANDVPRATQLREFKSAGDAISIAVALYAADDVEYVPLATFEPVISKVVETALRVSDPTYHENLEPAVSVEELAIAAVANEALLTLVNGIYAPREIPPTILGKLVVLANYASAICGDALDLAPTVTGGGPRASDMTAAKAAAPIAARMFLALSDIEADRCSH